MFHRMLAASMMATLCFASSIGAEKPKKVLLLAGPPSHGPGSHEHQAGMQLLQKCLSDAPGLTASVHDANASDVPKRIRGADGIVMFLDEGMRWQQAHAGRKTALEDLMARRGGVVGLHWSVGGRDAQYIPFHLKLLGGCHGGPDRKYTHADAKLRVAAAEHPIATAVQGFPLQDEYYYQLKWAKEGKITPILSATIREIPDQAIAWAFERPDGGRSFGLAALHTHSNWAVDDLRRLVTQSVLWTNGLPIPEKGLPVEITEKDLKLPPRDK